MKIIRYNMINRVNAGTEEAPVWEESKGLQATMDYNETNLETAKREAWNGEVTIEDDGEQEPLPSEIDIILELLADQEYRLCMIEFGGEL